jgi:hypothetical protein
MKKHVVLVFALVLLVSCAVIPRRVEIVQWPAEIRSLAGEGNLDLRWNGEKLSGSFALKMDYPDTLLLEVYGSPFGQTVVHLEKDRSKFLLIAGDEKTTDESLLTRQYAFGVRQLIDGLAMKGERQEMPGGGLSIRHDDYFVVYGQDRKARRSVCWERGSARLCLTFGDLSYNGS